MMRFQLFNKSNVKFVERVYRYCFRRFHTQPFIMSFDKKLLKKHRIVFYLNYPQYIHFGDTLWFEPIVRLFNQHYDNVYVYPLAGMVDYFRGLGYKVLTNADEITKTDIFVSRLDMAYVLRRHKKLLIDFSYTKLTAKLIPQLLTGLAEFLHLENAKVISKPARIDISSQQQQQLITKFNLNAKQQYILFNNYMDSYDLQLPPEDFAVVHKKLDSYIRNFCAQYSELKVIYIGSSKDLLHNNEIPDFIDVDLRGKTTIADLFILASLPTVKYYVGYDTFIMHLFNIYDKDSYIRLRPCRDEYYNNQVRQFVALPFAPSNNKITFI